VQVADRAFAADRAVHRALRRNAEPFAQLSRRILVAPAHQVDEVDGVDLGDKLCARILLGALERLCHQRQRLEPLGRIGRLVGDLADTDDDWNAAFIAHGLPLFLPFRPVALE
jgi:hypothetical protein